MTSGSKRVLEKGQIERKDSYGNSTEGQSTRLPVSMIIWFLATNVGAEPRVNIHRETVLVRCGPIPDNSRLFRRELNLCYRLDAIETVFPWNNQPNGALCCLSNVSSFIASAIVRPSVSDQGPQ
jgi:hypothetical protein